MKVFAIALTMFGLSFSSLSHAVDKIDQKEKAGKSASNDKLAQSEKVEKLTSINLSRYMDLKFINQRKLGRKDEWNLPKRYRPVAVSKSTKGALEYPPGVKAYIEMKLQEFVFGAPALEEISANSARAFALDLAEGEMVLFEMAMEEKNGFSIRNMPIKGLIDEVKTTLVALEKLTPNDIDGRAKITGDALLYYTPFFTIHPVKKSAPDQIAKRPTPADWNLEGGLASFREQIVVLPAPSRKALMEIVAAYSDAYREARAEGKTILDAQTKANQQRAKLIASRTHDQVFTAAVKGLPVQTTTKAKVSKNKAG